MIFNVVLLPRLGGQKLYRADELARGVSVGIVSYPLAILVVIVTFRQRPDIAAAVWGILAFGDGGATLAGQVWGGRRLPWNPDKTIAGSCAFAIMGTTAGVLLAAWTAPAVDPGPGIWFILGAPTAAAFVAAVIESLPVRLDDNLSVPAAAAVIMWGLSLATPEDSVALLAALKTLIAPAIVLNVVVALLVGWASAAVRPSGAITGAVIGTTLYVCVGVSGWILLFATFAAATAASRVGHARKTALDIAEAHQGRRGVGNVLANTGLAAFAAVLAGITPFRGEAVMAMVAALTAGGSDTVAGELGKASGGRTISLTRFRAVRPGTPGGISVVGSLSGVAAAAALAAIAAAGGLLPGSEIWIVVVGATIGSVAESVLGAAMEPAGLLDNNLLNVINTGVAAAAALVLLGASS